MHSSEKAHLLQRSFKIGILIKGIDGFFEVIGGILLVLINPIRLQKIVFLLTQHELSEDPNDVVANFMLGISRSFSVSSQHFGIVYLLSHGAVKLFLVSMLWRKKLWAYPYAIIFLSLFVNYQIYRYTVNHSIWLLGLVLLDIATIILIWAIYQRDQGLIRHGEDNVR